VIFERLLYNRDMTSTQVTFIGGGNMASAIIGGLLTRGASPQSIRVVDPDASVCERLKAEKGIDATQTLEAAWLGVDVVVLAVKPQVMPEALEQLAALWPASNPPMVMSVAGGITIDRMAKTLGAQAIVRCMPNTPALVGAGITALVGNALTSAEHQQLASHLMDQVGTHVWLDDESLLDLVTAVSGSGPAYFFALAEHMINAASARGMDDALAKALVHQTALGAGKMLGAEGMDASTLRRNVTSPGGTTEAALTVFDSADFGATVDQAIEAAWQRAQALGQTATPSSPTPKPQET